MDDKAEFHKKAYELLGGREGCQALAESFYTIMDKAPGARRIRKMHAPDIQDTCDNFALFLCGWLGGPPLYREKYGPLDLTGLHALLQIGEEDKDMWLSCMDQAIAQQPIGDEFKKYLKGRFRLPAEKIHNWCQKQGVQPSPDSGMETLNKL